MKTIYLKRSLWLAAILLAALSVAAQTKIKPKTAYHVNDNNTYYRIHNDGDRRIGDIKTEYNGKVYKIEYIDEKMASLFVDGEKVPEADWSKYSDATDHIRTEIKEMAKRDAEQAVRNQEQAKRNAEQARLNEEQQKRNQEQALRNQEQARRDKEQAALNEKQQKRNAEQAIRNQEQAKRNAEQAARDGEQEKRNAEQMIRDQEQAKAMEALMNELKTDLANDKIIRDQNDLRDFKINDDGMSVNGVKQPDEVFKKYRAKYNKENYGVMRDFNYSRDGYQ